MLISCKRWNLVQKKWDVSYRFWYFPSNDTPLRMSCSVYLIFILMVKYSLIMHFQWQLISPADLPRLARPLPRSCSCLFEYRVSLTLGIYIYYRCLIRPIRNDGIGKSKNSATESPRIGAKMRWTKNQQVESNQLTAERQIRHVLSSSVDDDNERRRRR